MTIHILKLREVRKITGLSSSSIYRLIKTGKFPKQIRLSERASGWPDYLINQWVEDRIAASRDEAA